MKSINRKPLTKALHTVRVVRNVADHLLEQKGAYEDIHEEALNGDDGLVTSEVLFARVCIVLDNELPHHLSPLYEMCQQACRAALQAHEAEVRALELALPRRGLKVGVVKASELGNNWTAEHHLKGRKGGGK